jgi:hypothetical protein
MDGVAYSALQNYDTVVVGKENYDEYIDRATSAPDRTTRNETWFGTPIRQAIKRAASRLNGEPRENVARGVSTPSGTEAKYSLGTTVGLTDERVNKLVDTFIYLQNGDEKKTKGYIAYVSPKDFLNATIPLSGKEALESEKEPLDIDRLSKAIGPIGLQVEPTEGRKHELTVTGHEGRHRMMALRDAGVENVPVIFEFIRGENREPIDDLFIHPQKFGKDNYGIRGFVAYGLEPINYENRNAVKQKFSQGNIKYSLGTVEGVIDDGVERLVASARKSRLNELEDRNMVGLARADSNLTKIQLLSCFNNTIHINFIYLILYL